MEDSVEGMEGQEDVGDMERTRIAIPSVGEGGLQAPVSPHFGRCDSYTIVTLQDGRIEAVESLQNGTHTDCSSPVQLLAKNGVGLMLVGGMGMRPYLAFKEKGIEIRHGTGSTVADTIEAYIKNETQQITEDTLCNCQSNHSH
jgi:predicted Fe-Mo cluster-binding NifX family protein